VKIIESVKKPILLNVNSFGRLAYVSELSTSPLLTKSLALSGNR